MKIRKRGTKKAFEVYVETEVNPFFNPKRYVAIDTETTGVDVWGLHYIEGVLCEDAPFAVSMCDENGNGWYCEWAVNPFTREITPNPADVIFIQYILSIQNIECIFHNSKFDCRMLAKVGINVSELIKRSNGKIHDTLFQARVCFTLELDYGLKPLSKRILGITDEDEKDLQNAVVSARRKVNSYNIRAAKEGKPMMIKADSVKADYWLPRYFARQIGSDNELCKKYCMLDTFRTMGLHLFYHDLMSEDPYLMNKYIEEMQEIWPIVNSMEERGMRAFPDAVETESTICKTDMETHLINMQSIITENNLLPLSIEKMTPPATKRPRNKPWIPPPFNPGSSGQVMRVLYLPEGEGGLGIETKFNRKLLNKGIERATADKDALRELMYHPFVRELAGYRAASHTKTLFFDKFGELMKPDPKYHDCMVVHPGLNQCGTKTGRFSCANPL
jgi:DNA polymerase I-like protein with 3'-5' exonuclease and polymerase domains